MGKLLRYADVFEGTQNGTVEARDHSGLYGYTSRMGRSTADIDCPFCGSVVEVFLWSLAGGGKRCSCGALIGRTQAYARVAAEPKGSY